MTVGRNVAYPSQSIFYVPSKIRFGQSRLGQVRLGTLVEGTSRLLRKNVNRVIRLYHQKTRCQWSFILIQ
jgi:hypothetical protein